MIDFSPENENRIEFRSMTTPLTGVKYRTPSAALRCLAEGTLYFAKPSELNDTLEAKYDHATPEDFSRVMAQTYSEISQQRGGPVLDFDQRGMAEMAEAHARECQRLQAFTEQIGIFSAAQRPDHQAMWAYYADNASGVCFELEWSQEIVDRHQLCATDVQYHGEARVHNRAEDWRHVFLELAQEHPDASLDALHQLSLEEEVRREWGCRAATRAASIKHTDWSHEKEIRLLAPKSGALPVLGEVLKRVHLSVRMVSTGARSCNSCALTIQTSRRCTGNSAMANSAQFRPRWNFA